MPTYHLPNGKIIHSDNPLSAEDLDSLVGDDNKAQPGETGIKWINDLVRPRLQQLAGQEEGPLNPDPNKNPLVAGSQLSETEQSPGVIGAIRHGLYENVIRPMASPLGVLGMFMGEDIPKEPIGMMDTTAKDIELPKQLESVPKVAESKYELPQPKQLGPAKDIQLPESKLNQPSISDQGYYNPKPPAEQLHPNDIRPSSEVINPSLDELNSKPIIPKSVDEINKIPPGQADVAPVTNGKDISAFRAEASSPHVIMENFPQTTGIIQPILNAQDEGTKWLATTMRDFTEVSKGLNGTDRRSLWMIMNGEEVPGASQDLYARAAQAKQLTDKVYDLAQEKSSSDIGFQDRYATHIKAQPEDIQSAMRDIFDRQLGDKSPIKGIFSSEESAKPSGDIGDLYEKGLGNPESQFIKPRKDLLQDVETDYDKVMPIYLESMKKSIFDRPATDASKDALGDIPQGRLKEWLQAYIRNYSRYDSDAQLAGAWSRLASQIGTINARSVISFNPLVHMYHAGQLPANIWPELGTKYSLAGMKQFASDPAGSYQELAKNGLFSNMIRPMQFQTPMQKFDSVSYYMNMVESIVKGTGYYGFKQRALDAGMSDVDATMHAIQQTKNATATVDPARNMRFFTPESNVAGGQLLRLGKQYRQIPAKLIEQFSRAAADWKNNPAKAARYIAGTAIAGAGSAAGIHTLHASPLSLVSELGSISPLGGQFTNVMKGVYKNLAKGDVGSALGDIATWAVPGGNTIKKLVAQ